MRTAARLIALCLFAFPHLVSAQQRGDVNGDAVIDGRDALRVMRVAEGLVAPTEVDLKQGDVHPLPGTEGRAQGDGMLTRDDAQRLLQVSVGLVDEGLVTGNVSPPTVDAFIPQSGSPGDTLAVFGTGFTPDDPAFTLVFFGDTQAEVVGADEGTLLVRMPPGVTQAPLTVLGLGGSTTTEEAFRTLAQRRFRAALPGDRSPEDYVIASALFEQHRLTADGVAMQIIPGSSLLITVVSEEEDNLLTLLYFDDGAAAPEEVVIDTRTTAEALLRMAPPLQTNLGAAQDAVRAGIHSVAETETLAEVLEACYTGASCNPEEDAAVGDALNAAVAAILSQVPAAYIRPFPTDGTLAGKGGGGTVLPQPNALTHRRFAANDAQRIIDIYYPDALTGELTVMEATTITRDRAAQTASIQIQDAMGNPLEWISRTSRIEDAVLRDEFPEGARSLNDPDFWRPNLASADGRPVLTRAEGADAVEEVTVVQSSSNLDYLGVGNVSALTDFVGRAVTDSLGKAINTTGAITFPEAITIPTDRDGLYVVRHYSGMWPIAGLRDPELLAEAEHLNALEDGRLQAWMAFITNAMIAGADVWAGLSSVEAAPACRSIGNDVGDLGSSDASTRGKALDRLKSATNSAQLGQRGWKKVVKAVAPATARIISRSSEMSYTEYARTVTLLAYEIALDIAGAVSQNLIERSAECLTGNGFKNSVSHAFVKAMGQGVRIAARSSLVILQGVMVAQAAERLFDLFSLNPFTRTTPLETWVVVVGDPFSPQIESFTPEAGTFGTEIVITGRQFGEAADEAEVFLGTHRLELLEHSPTRIKARIPELWLREPQRALAISVKTKTGRQDSRRAIGKFFTATQSLRITQISSSSTEQVYDPTQRLIIPGNDLDIQTAPVFTEAQREGLGLGFTLGGGDLETLLERANASYRVTIPENVQGAAVSEAGYTARAAELVFRSVVNGATVESEPVVINVLNSPVINDVTPSVL
ncbi:MAG: IPT/TIG domain-containing protein, partial [Bacteroidota bacterium]